MQKSLKPTQYWKHLIIKKNSENAQNLILKTYSLTSNEIQFLIILIFRKNRVPQFPSKITKTAENVNMQNNSVFQIKQWMPYFGNQKSTRFQRLDFLQASCFAQQQKLNT